MENKLEVVFDDMRHLACIPYSLKNLHIAAAQVGIKRCWFHRDHYDIPLKCITRIKARPDCREITPQEMVRLVRNK